MLDATSVATAFTVTVDGPVPMTREHALEICRGSRPAKIAGVVTARFATAAVVVAGGPAGETPVGDVVGADANSESEAPSWEIAAAVAEATAPASESLSAGTVTSAGTVPVMSGSATLEG